jgi:hypothetical protein
MMRERIDCLPATTPPALNPRKESKGPTTMIGAITIARPVTAVIRVFCCPQTISKASEANLGISATTAEEIDVNVLHWSRKSIAGCLLTGNNSKEYKEVEDRR